MRQNSAVKNMQRVPHLHTFRNGIRVNGRDVCDSCPHRDPRPMRLGSKREAYSFEAKRIREAALMQMTIPTLKEWVANRPGLKVGSKMRKPELVSAILDYDDRTS